MDKGTGQVPQLVSSWGRSAWASLVQSCAFSAAPQHGALGDSETSPGAGEPERFQGQHFFSINPPACRQGTTASSMVFLSFLPQHVNLGCIPHPEEPSKRQSAT